MRMYGKTLTEFTETELQQLVADGQEENLRIEFKLDCYNFTDETSKQEKRKEFCKDVLALANASGGWIFCGIAESSGRASKLVGLEKFDPDAQKRRLGQWLDNDAQPRLSQFNTHTVSLADGKSVFIIEIPRSFAAPHRNTQTNEFPLRRVGRIEPNMTIDDLRRAFVGGENYAEQIRTFREGRVLAVHTPGHVGAYAPLMPRRPLWILHVLPVVMMEERYRFPLSTGHFANSAFVRLDDFNYYMSGMVHNLDGLLFRSGNTNRDHIDAYFQVFRSGAIEHVRVYEESDGRNSELVYRHWVDHVIEGLSYCLELQRGLGVEEPFFVALTLAHISQFRWVATASSHSGRSPSITIRHDPLRFPEQYFEQRDIEPKQMLRSTFDVWANGCGWPQSPCYDKDGLWIESR